MQNLFQKLPRYELAHDLTPRVMKRVSNRQVAVAYRRLVVTTLTLGLAVFGLIGYRWYTFLQVRDYSAVIGTILSHLGHISGLVTIGYWSDAFVLIRQSLPMVETTLLAVTFAMVGLFFWKLLRLPREPQWQREDGRLDRVLA